MDWPTLITIFAVFCGLQAVAGGLVYVERKVCAFMQNRVGPNRVGPVGLLQILADGLKFIMKEEFVPKYADRVLFIAAPAIGMVAAMLSFAVVPFGATDNPNDLDYAQKYQFMIAKNIDIGILFIFAVSSLTVYGIILGGWASNNKYSLLGGLRSSAQIISYEIPLGLSVIGVVLLTGSLNLEHIIWQQAKPESHWNIWFQPLAFVLFMISAFAECNRLPFDLPETEQELVGGYHTEYNAMKLAFFFVGEYTHMITTSFLMVILFFGGWDFPFVSDWGWGFKLVVMLVKVALFILFYMLVRWTIPRFRFDQLMALAWKVFIPMALVNLIAVMFVKEFGLPLWILTLVSLLVLIAGGFAVSQPATKARKALV